MNSKTKPARRTSEELRSVLVDVATVEFANRGFAAVGARELAAAAGVTVPAIYRHFGSMRGLYEVCCLSESRKATALLGACLQRKGPAKRLLREYTEQMCKLMLEPSPWHKLLKRQLLDTDQAVMAQIRDVGFYANLKRLTELSTALVGTEEDARSKVFSVHAVAYGCCQLAPIQNNLRWTMSEYRSSRTIARHVLRLVYPAVDW